MRRRLKIENWHEYGMTSLEMTGPEIELELKILTRTQKRERRALVRSFLVQIRPWLKHFEEVTIDHSPYGGVRTQRGRERKIRVFKGAPISSERGRIGYEIRTARLKAGVTQAELAERISIRRSHLSDIERGIYRPSAETLKRIQAELMSGGDPTFAGEGTSAL